VRPGHRLLPLLVALAVAGARLATAQVSPGPLAEAHRELDGATQCFQCHPRGGSGTMDARCLACHTEIAWLRARNRGTHARVGKRECASCHPDHAGREFRMIAWKGGSPESFDHREAGFALEGKHARVECRACHAPKLQRPPLAAMIRVKDRTRTWLGLDPACASCHEDPHRGALGATCERCHDLAAWKPAPRFDHARTRYPLTGRHAEVACAKCHEAPGLSLAHDAQGRAVPRYKPLPFAECSACHRDPHAGRFGPKCAKCHGTDSFQRVDARHFDHDRTRYPLRGRHATVPCASCHDPKQGGSPKPPFATCASCHRDAHGGRGTLAGKPADCAACHTVTDFRTSTFTVAQHRATPYPLEGRHATADCSACHRRLPSGRAAAVWGTSRVELRPPHQRCADCHADPHRGRFEPGGARPRAESCLACHGLDRFRPSRMDAAAHEATRYPLDGAHRATPCQACHPELKAAPAASTLLAAAGATRPLLFADERRRCAECHPDPHGQQFATRRDRGACEACHGIEAFVPASRFDHNRDSAFKLEGVHARTACGGCHRTERAASGAARVVYRGTPTRCESCHVTPPRGARGRLIVPRRSTPELALVAPEETHEVRLVH
jgi:hypothetical protein